MLSDWELWAVANKMLEQHGDDAQRFVAERIGKLAVDGDKDGTATWRQVARRLAELTKPAPTRLDS